MIPLVLSLMLLLPTSTASDEPPIKVTLSELRYGTMEIRAKKRTGSQIRENWRCGKITEQTDRIEAKLGNGFGINVRIAANTGKNLIIVTHWEPPEGYFDPIDGDILRPRFHRVRNDAEFHTCFRFDVRRERVSGPWKISVYLVGIDESISKARK